MATFGTIASSAPNVLFNPMGVDQAVQGAQRNQLMMQNSRQDQQQQTIQRDAEARIGMARELSNLPETDAAAQWGTYRQRLQSAGLGQGLPEQFPGMARIRAVASSDLTTFQRMQIEERRRSSEALMGALGIGGGAPAAPPAAGAAPPSSAPVAPSGGMPSAGINYGPNAPRLAERDALLDAPPAVLAAASQANLPPGQPAYNPARPGANSELPGWDAGVAPPTGRVMPITPTAARTGGTDVAGPMPPAAAPAPPQPAAPTAPAVQGLLPNGLTRQQAAMVAATAASNPTQAASMIAQFQQQNTMAGERATDNARAERQFAASQAQTQEANRRADEAARRAEAAALRQETGQADAAARAERTAAQPGEGERRAASYLERMNTAEQMLQGLTQREGYSPGNIQDRVAQHVPGFLGGNFLVTEPGQRYLNAAAEWARAKLRLESGAVISDSEAVAEARTYFPMPGDSPATIAQKEELRRNASAAIRIQAGRATGQADATTPRPEGAPQAPTQGGEWSIRPVGQ